MVLLRRKFERCSCGCRLGATEARPRFLHRIEYLDEHRKKWRLNYSPPTPQRLWASTFPTFHVYVNPLAFEDARLGGEDIMQPLAGDD